MKKSSIAMKIISVLAALALVVSTCFIPETSRADNIDNTQEAEQSPYSCDAVKLMNDDGYIIVHEHNEYCYDEETGMLICPLTELKQEDVHTHGDGCYTWVEEAVDVNAGDSVQATEESQLSTAMEESSEADTTDIESEDVTGEESTTEIGTTEIAGTEISNDEENDGTSETSDMDATSEVAQASGDTSSEIPSDNGGSGDESQVSTPDAAEETPADDEGGGDDAEVTEEINAADSGKLSDGVYLYGDAGDENSADTAENIVTLDSENNNNLDGNTTAMYKELTCTQKGLHTHAGNCFDEAENLVCHIPEVTLLVHNHDESCLEAVEEIDVSKRYLSGNEAVRDEIAKLINGNISSVLDGTYAGVPEKSDTWLFYNYYMQLYRMASGTDSVTEKALKYGLSEDEAKAAIVEVYSLAASYTSKIYYGMSAVKDAYIDDYITKYYDENGTVNVPLDLLQTPTDEAYRDYIESILEAFVNNSTKDFAKGLGIDTESENTTYDDVVFQLSLLYEIDLNINYYRMLRPVQEVNTSGEKIDCKYEPITYNGMVAFSLDAKKTKTSGVEYTVSTVSNTLGSDYTLYEKVSYAASMYSGYYMRLVFEKHNDLLGLSSSAETPEVLREAVQYAIWEYIYGKDNVTYTASQKVKNCVAIVRAYTDTYYWQVSPSSDWDWCEPDNKDNSPNLIISNIRKEYNSDYYVGFAEELVGELKKTVAFYLTDQRTYDVSLDENIRKTNSEIAYCFNETLSAPYSRPSGNYYYAGLSLPEARCLYKRNEDVNGIEFKKYTRSCIVDADTLRNMVISIGLNGYPNNYSNLRGGLSDDSFKVVTQYAIWYYTDNMDFSSFCSAAEKEVYYNLIKTNLFANKYSDVAESVVDIYLPQGGAYSGDAKTYQNLLIVRKITPEEKEEIKEVIESKTFNLKVTKKVVGDTSGKTFNFTVKINDNNGNPFSYTNTATDGSITSNIKLSDSSIAYTDNGSGSITFSIKGGQSVTIKGLPNGSTYTIEEDSESAKDYTTQIQIGKDSLNTDTYTAKGTISDSDVNVTYINTYNKTETEDNKYNLTVKKTVENNDNYGEKFPFTITIKDKNGNVCKDITNVSDTTGNGVSVADGVITFSLRKDGTFTLNDIPEGYTYEIVENENSGDYKTTIKAPAGASVRNDTKTVSNKISSNETVTYTNKYIKLEEPVVPTGVRVDVLPYIVVCAIAVLGLAAFIVRKRIQKDGE